VTVNLHAVEPRSLANGPGLRFVVWFHGCTLGCPGCFNPDTHFGAPRLVLTVEELLGRLAGASAEVEGLTVTGGEPFQQPQALLALLAGVQARTSLSTLVFSGYRLDEIRRRPLGKETLRHVDVLVDGRYEAARHHGLGLRGSSNQRAHLLTSRYALDDIERVPAGEILIDPQGRVTVSGVDPLRVHAL
jgi:anaerobic ribonucleoside-triphosphate reductase activating protein